MFWKLFWCVPGSPDLLEKFIIDFFALELLPHFFSFLGNLLLFLHPDLFLDKSPLLNLLNTSLFLCLSIPSDLLIENLLVLSIE